MLRRIIVLDTSIFCCWLKVPGKETAGSGASGWDHARVSSLIDKEVNQFGATLVLPLAAVIETGNHIANASSQRFEKARELARHLTDAVGAASPWAAFTQQAVLWEKENIERLANEWPDLAKAGLSLADATMSDVADYYARTGYSVQLLTADRGLSEYRSFRALLLPRRRSAID